MARTRLTTPIRFWPGPLKARAEPVVPMVNIVFLMLMFLLMAAHFADPGAGGTRGLVANADAPANPRLLILAASGALTYGPLREAEAVAAAVAAGPVRLQAEGTVEARHLARALDALARAGASRVDVVTPGTGTE